MPTKKRRRIASFRTGASELSTTSLIEFHGGKADIWHEFRNSWGGAARIWDSLFKAYVPKKFAYDNWLIAAQDGRLWTLPRDERLDDNELLVYYLCCDNALVKSEFFAEMAAALRAFAERHPVAGQTCCHLSAWAEVFDRSDAEAIGLHATSVCEDPWRLWNEEDGEYEPYNIKSGDKHWFISDRMNATEDVEGDEDGDVADGESTGGEVDGECGKAETK